MVDYFLKNGHIHFEPYSDNNSEPKQKVYLIETILTQKDQPKSSRLTKKDIGIQDYYKKYFEDRKFRYEKSDFTFDNIQNRKKQTGEWTFKEMIGDTLANERQQIDELVDFIVDYFIKILNTFNPVPPLLEKSEDTDTETFTKEMFETQMLQPSVICCIT